jgi:hypothetical protein
MAFILKGNLSGYLCDDCIEAVSNVQIRIYSTDKQRDIIAAAVAATKDTFRSLTDEQVEAKSNRLIAEGTTDKAGNFEVSIGGNYNGEAFDIDFYCGNVPRFPPKPKLEFKGRQFHLTTIAPQWRQLENINAASLAAGDYVFGWQYVIPTKLWCFIRGYYFDAWTICGRLLHCKTQKPLVGFEVTAFDADFFTDDTIGSAITDASGHFRIDYSSADFKKTFLSPYINIETNMGLPFGSGPDVYFHVAVPGVSPKIYALQEPRSTANTAGRKDVGYCVCVELCANVEDIPQVNIVPPSFRRVGNYSIATDFDAAGFTTVGKYAFTETLSLIGDLPNGGNSNKVEYRFRVVNLNTSTEIPWASLKTAFPSFQIGHLKKQNTALPLTHPTYPYEDVPVTINPVTDADADGWIVAPHQNDLSNGGAGLFIPNAHLAALDTTKLVQHFFDLTTPTIHEAGNPINAADKFLAADHTFRIIFEAREVGTSAVTTSNTLSKIVVWNGQPTQAFRQRRHPSWSGGTIDLRGVCMLNLVDSMGADKGCGKIATSVNVQASVYHPYLESTNMTIEGPLGVNPVSFPIPAPSASGEVVISDVHTFAASDPDCAYIFDLYAGYRLTNGNAAGGAHYFNTDRIAFCKITS